MIKVTFHSNIRTCSIDKNAANPLCIIYLSYTDESTYILLYHVQMNLLLTFLKKYMLQMIFSTLTSVVCEGVPLEVK